MFILDRMKNVQLFEKALDAENLRRKVIANNVANVDVPHFKRSEVNFESELSRAVRQDADSKNGEKALVNDNRHIPFVLPVKITDVHPKVRIDYNTTLRNDGNNVDMEKETVDAAQNVLRYNSFVQMVTGSFSKLKNIMKSSQ